MAFGSVCLCLDCESALTGCGIKHFGAAAPGCDDICVVAVKSVGIPQGFDADQLFQQIRRRNSAAGVRRSGAERRRSQRKKGHVPLFSAGNYMTVNVN
ncbi:hypothetical protein Acid345_3998 [Candidatus Koribacter versatilis Ellin345]|uniref:Uncharacterized protein n=1 Tax=Koribacter versatilis (strain Ellin345) TaxID=204669 RepID=Q1IJF2_KORVE|nr:hypothetical protein Acid345_3998 [Candidatus Koribacter versatilis Ellin345]